MVIQASTVHPSVRQIRSLPHLPGASPEVHHAQPQCLVKPIDLSFLICDENLQLSKPVLVYPVLVVDAHLQVGIRLPDCRELHFYGTPDSGGAPFRHDRDDKADEPDD